eukprot:TRINITY_DN2398_c0_g1_i7.p1 TRINITY_DN2398_c0_g1~~TRINITY_DN2398_c0_g1_i7.p1  ORF type:complete len:439 (-),score=42.99 TRINITY_DN2398_c0_g1_i7:201-1517(-)
MIFWPGLTSTENLEQSRQLVHNALIDSSCIIRHRLKDLIQYYNNPTNMVIDIWGIRRCGKTTLLKQLIKYLVEEKNVGEEEILFIDTELFDLKNQDSLNQFLYYAKKKIIFIDEIQTVDGWERLVRNYRVNFPDTHFILCGSQSDLISKNIDTFLTGQHLTFEVQVFTYREFKEFHKTQNDDVLLPLYKKFGGFPLVATHSLESHAQYENNAMLMLQNILQDIVNKDCKRFDLTMEEVLSSLRAITRKYFSSTIVGINTETLEFLEKICLIKHVVTKKGIKRYYCIDSGLWRAIYLSTTEFPDENLVTWSVFCVANMYQFHNVHVEIGGDPYKPDRSSIHLIISSKWAFYFMKETQSTMDIAKILIQMSKTGMGDRKFAIVSSFQHYLCTPLLCILKVGEFFDVSNWIPKSVIRPEVLVQEIQKPPNLTHLLRKQSIW